MRHLIDLIFPPRADERLLREISLDTFLVALRPTLVSDTRPATIALFSYGDPHVRAALHEAKYHGNSRAFTYLGYALAEYLRDLDDVGRRTSYILVPVPLGRNRRKERGFNQMEEVAHRALRSLGAEKYRHTLEPDLLERVRETHTQVSLPREQREQNMRGAFGAAHPIDPTANYILVDDVLTTGATLQAAIDALRAAGASSIIPIALAH